MRAILGKLSVLVLAAGLASSAIVTGCSSNGDEKAESAGNKGSIGFQLDVGGANINTLHVVVYGNSLGAVGASTNIVRDLDVGALTGSSTAFTLTLPAGSNYQVKLSTPDNASCAGTGTFNVIAGQSNASTIAVTLSCSSVDNTGGQTVDVNACTPPVVNSVFVGPNSQVVGHKIQLVADVQAGSTVQWTQTGAGTGTFDTSTGASANFTCVSAGAISIQLGLSLAGCSTSKSYAVNCTGAGAPAGGAGGAPGAAGAPAAGAPAGGAPAGGAPAGGAPAGGAPAAGAPAAGAPAAGGAPGAGAPGAGAPAGGAPAAGAPGAGAPGAGAPSAGAPGASCPGSVNNSTGNGQVCSTQYTVDECGTNCAQITTDACRACELADENFCYSDGDPASSLLDMAGAIAYYGASSTPPLQATPARVQAGIAAEACIYSSHCASAPGSSVYTNCYCGTAGSSCTSPGTANGPCKSQLEAALDTTAPLAIATNLGDPGYGGGVAQVRIDCDQRHCAAACLH